MKNSISKFWYSSDRLKHVRLRFLNSFNREQALEYLQNRSRLAVIPSLTENFPGTVFECVSTGISFISSDVGGIPEMIHQDDRKRTLFRPVPRDLSRIILNKIMNNDGAPVRPSVSPNDIQARIIAFHGDDTKTFQRNTISVSGYRPRPKVTVCIPHFNRPDMLLYILKKWEKQQYENFDLIVVDDGSSESVQHLLNTTIIPILNHNNWKLLRAKHGYLGATRNKCVQAAVESTKYVLFSDDDNFARDDALKVLVDVSERTDAKIVTSFIHMYHGRTLEESQNEKTNGLWLFGGGSLSMGVIFNAFGDSMMLVERETFAYLGGFTEFVDLGCEDYEFYMRAKSRGIRIEIIPQDLFFSQKKEVSMQTQMDVGLSQFRAFSPLLQAYPELADGFMALKGVTEAQKKQKITTSSSETIEHQGSHGWEYGFCRHKIGNVPQQLTDCKFERMTQFDAEYMRYHMIEKTGVSWPHVGKYSMHPYTGNIQNNLVALTAARRFTSFLEGPTTIWTTLKSVGSCGDGVYVQLFHNSVLLWGKAILPDNIRQEKMATEIEMRVSDVILLLVSPNLNSDCDTTNVLIKLFTKSEISRNK